MIGTRILRLFIALAIPSVVRDQVAAASSGLIHAKWVDRNNLHLTIRFIGEVEENLAEDLHETLSTLTFQPFTLRLKGIDCFRSKKKVRTIWAAVPASGRLNALQKKVDRRLVLTGLPAETRKFKPHVTMARVSASPLNAIVPYLETHADFETEEFQVDQVFMFQSHLGRKNSHYEILQSYGSL